MTKRQIQVGEEIKQIVSVLLQRELRDPRLGFVTVMAVAVTQDLKYARIYVSVMGSDDEQRSTMDALGSGRGFIRREIASRMHLRAVPEIHFKLDHGAEFSDQINRLLGEIKVAEEEKVVGAMPDLTAEEPSGDKGEELAENDSGGAEDAGEDAEKSDTTEQ